MRILLVNKFLYPKGGDAIVTIRTSELLKSYGHEVHLWGMHHPENPDYPLQKYFVANINYDAQYPILKKIAIALKILFSFEARKKFAIVLDIVKPDIVHLNNIAHQISPSILIPIKKRKIPVVMTLHDYKLVCPVYSLLRNGKPCELCRKKRYYNCVIYKCAKNSFFKSLVNTIEMYLHHTILDIYGKIDCFIAPSAFLSSKHKDMAFFHKMVVISNFIDRGSIPEPDDLSGNYIIYAGRLSLEKGLFTLIKSMESIKATLRIYGDGPIKSELEKMIVAAGLESRVFITGRIPIKRLFEEIKSALIAVCPSECYENNPISVIEAFSLGVPVVGARIGGIPELVRDGITGYTFTSGDSSDLSEKMRYLIENPGIAREMGRNAARLVREEYSGAYHYSKLMHVYEMTIPGK